MPGCYPNKPFWDIQFCIHLKQVQEMCRKCVAPTARFLVIAAPRPTGYQTWNNPGRTNRGALFCEDARRVAQTVK